MKEILFTSLALLSLAQQRCNKTAQSKVPPCITEKIEAMKQQARWNPPAEVTEYRYNGKRVFLFSSDCCDQYNTAVDESCNYVCAPSGGITGKGDRKCTDFAEKAEMVRVVWKDER